MMGVRLTTEEFATRAKMVHGEQYDYTKVNYTDDKCKIIIVCPKHGEFEQGAGSHLRGRGCAQCGIISSSKKRSKTTEWFIQKAKTIHGQRYNYEKTEYRGCFHKVTITCLTHGDFEQKPSGHLSGYGCIQCAGKQPLTTELFVSRAIKTHGQRYDYSLVNYISSSQKITIVCPVHGAFQQMPENHIKHGCNNCGYDKFRLTTSKFISRAKKIHGSSYDYSLTEYKDEYVPVTIICRTHGSFEQTPRSHLSGHKCQQCACNSTAQKLSGSTYDFVLRAKEIHGELYDYSKVNYQGSKVKVNIICPIHGEFKQAAGAHLNGHGCPKCNSSTGECLVRKTLENKGLSYKEQVRIASCRNINPLPFDFSVNTPDQRLIEFQGKQHYEPYSFRRSRNDTQEQMEANLARVQIHDAIKAKWCEENNVPLLVIPYWDKHRIPELLEEFLGIDSLVDAK